MVKHMASLEELQNEIKFLEGMNGKLSDEVEFLAQQLTLAQDIIKQLIDKLPGARANRTVNSNQAQDFEPVGGYVSLTDKIREAEEKAKKEYDQSQEAKDKAD